MWGGKTLTSLQNSIREIYSLWHYRPALQQIPQKQRENEHRHGKKGQKWNRKNKAKKTINYAWVTNTKSSMKIRSDFCQFHLSFWSVYLFTYLFFPAEKTNLAHFFLKTKTKHFLNDTAGRPPGVLVLVYFHSWWRRRRRVSPFSQSRPTRTPSILSESLNIYSIYTVLRTPPSNPQPKKKKKGEGSKKKKKKKYVYRPPLRHIV